MPAAVRSHSNVAPSWAAFLGLTAVVVVAMLVLARQSQHLLEDEGSADSAAADVDGPETPRTDRSVVRSDGQDPPADGPAEVSEASGIEDSGHGSTADPPVGSLPSLAPERSETPTDDGAGTTAPAGSNPSETADGDPADVTADTPGPPARNVSVGDLSPPVLLANVALTHGLFAGLVLGGAWFFAIPASAFGVEARPGSTGVSAVAVGLGFGVALWLANEAGARVADEFGVGYDESVRHLLAPESGRGWGMLLGLVLPLIAVGEEVVFRGALVGVAAVGLGSSPWLLAVVSSVAFALGHGAQGTAGIVVTGVLGFVLAAGFVLTGSLLVVIVAHYVVNALEFVVHEGIGIDGIADTGQG